MEVMLDEGAFMPERAHETDAGADIHTPVDVVIPAHGFAFVDTGVHMAAPHGTYLRIASKSGLNREHGITVEGVVDEGYTGPIGLTLHNSSDRRVVLHAGEKVAQVICEPCYYVSFEYVGELAKTARGDSGFGSTGR